MLFKTKYSYNHLLLLIIIAVGIILRFYHFFAIPYTPDEFGAVVYDTRFETFNELINKWVMFDGHPAGIQVFLYYWVKIVGINPYWVKLPFLLAGIASIYLAWLIGKKWFNNSSALIVAAYISCLEFTVTYSQIARSYISGLFFVLLMVNAWSNIILFPEKKFFKNLVVYILASALCAYNHHFCLLQAIIVGFTGLFFCKRNLLKYYILSGIVIFLLYVPHLGIFFNQLHTGGLEWLGKPHKEFVLNYLEYIAQFSWIVTFSFIAIIILSLLFGFNKKFYKNKFFIVSVLWFIIPITTGLIYSRLVSPVIQYSMLIFSFPFLLFAFFSFIKETKNNISTVYVALIIFTVVPSLIFERQHYKLFYQSFNDESITVIRDFEKLKHQSADAVVDCPDWINYYYFKKNLFPVSNYLLLDSIKTKKQLQQYIKNSNKNFMLYMESSAAPREYYKIIHQHFPYVNYHKCFLGGDYYVFSKTDTSNINDIIFEESCPLFNDSNINKWSNFDKNKIIRNNTNLVYRIDSSMEYGLTFSNKLSEMIKNTNNIIDISVKALPVGEVKNLIVVATLENNSGTIFWSGSDLINYDKEDNGWINIYLSFKLPDISLEPERLIFKTSLWNKEKGEFFIADYKIQARYANPVIYSFVTKTYPFYNSCN